MKSIAAITSALTLATGLATGLAMTAAGTAHAERQVVMGSGPGSTAGNTLTSLRAVNGPKVIRVVAQFKKRLTTDNTLVIGLDSGDRDPGILTFKPIPQGGFYVVITADGAALHRVAKRKTYAVPCETLRGFAVENDTKVGVVIPQACLGAGAGMQRVEVRVSNHDDGFWGVARTRVLQQGKRGAAYGDVNGDGSVDTIGQRLVTENRYAVRVNTGSAVLRATAERWGGDAAWPKKHPVLSTLDIDRNGKADIIGNPHDAIGDGARFHLFTMVDGKLTQVKAADGKAFELNYAFAGPAVYRDFRCGREGLQTWETKKAVIPDGKIWPVSYRIKVTNFSFAAGTAVAGATSLRTVPAWAVDNGNYSASSCLTR